MIGGGSAKLTKCLYSLVSFKNLNVLNVLCFNGLCEIIVDTRDTLISLYIV